MSWIEDVDLSSVAPNEQENIKTYLGNYKSLSDALVGGYNHKKMVGEPFRLPKDFDKLNDDQKKDFTTKAKDMLKIEPAVTSDTIKQVNFSKGLPDDQEPNESVTSLIQDFAVKKGLTQSQTQDLIEKMNISGTELRAKMAKETDDNFKKAVETSHKILSDYYGEEKLKTESENLRKAFKNNLNLSNEEYEQIADDLLDDGWIFRHPALAKVLIDNFAKLAKEGETPESHRTEKTKQPDGKKRFSKSYEALGW